MKTTIDTACLDLDGFLVNTALFVREAYAHTFKTFDVENARVREMGCLNGATLRQVYGLVAEGETLELMCKTHGEFQDQNMHLIETVEGVIEALTELKWRKVHTIIVTSRSANTLKIMRHCAFDHLIDHIIGAHDVKNPKPHPEGILKALSHVGSSAETAFMGGDMPGDIEAGKAAGVITVGIATSNDLEGLKASKPDYLIRHFSELVPLFF